MNIKATNATGKCRVIISITDKEVFYCLKPATVLLVENVPEQLALCVDCARELAKDIIDCTPGGPGNLSRKSSLAPVTSGENLKAAAVMVLDERRKLIGALCLENPDVLTRLDRIADELRALGSEAAR